MNRSTGYDVSSVRKVVVNISVPPLRNVEGGGVQPADEVLVRLCFPPNMMTGRNQDREIRLTAEQVRSLVEGL